MLVQIKLFISSLRTQADGDNLEQMVNDWLRQMKDKILVLNINISADHAVIATYQFNPTARKKKR